MILVLALAAALAPPQDPKLDSGKPLPLEQACYDVRRYELRVRVDPQKRSVQGECRIHGRMRQGSPAVFVDLDSRLEVAQVLALQPGLAYSEAPRAEFRRVAGGLRIESPLFAAEAGEFIVEIDYRGTPREAPNPPWDGGFTWSSTKSGAPWIATSNQMQGGDLWWPCKDQPDDEPDEGMSISITVPKPLVAASNGHLVSTQEKEPGWLTYDWQVTTPINAYGVALNIAPYATITREYTSLAGDAFPVTYWVLPENLAQGKVLFDDILKQMRGLEELFGPYPFRGDKYGVAETPHLGMEHQSIIAYGNEYRGNPWGNDHGLDFLHLHEFAHEWWANLVTARNWNDFWIHEGFATYAEALYTEKVAGKAGYLDVMSSKRGHIANQAPVAPREPRTATAMYTNGDIYAKGAWVLHSLRFLLGDELFFRALRRMAYPDPALEATTDGRACRFATSDELRAIVEQVSGRDLGWFFEVYLRQPHLPKLVVGEGAGAEANGWKGAQEVVLRWQTPTDLSFPMPVEVQVGARRERVEMPGGRGVVRKAKGEELRIDPDHWLLRDEGP
jgi:aminopeptidase N